MRLLLAFLDSLGSHFYSMLFESMRGLAIILGTTQGGRVPAASQFLKPVWDFHFYLLLALVPGGAGWGVGGDSQCTGNPVVTHLILYDSLFPHPGSIFSEGQGHWEVEEFVFCILWLYLPWSSTVWWWNIGRKAYCIRQAKKVPRIQTEKQATKQLT